MADLFVVIRGSTVRQLNLVLEAGGNVNVQNERLETPLMSCLINVKDVDKRAAVIQTLLRFGADVNIPNARGQTAFMYACILNQLPSVTLLLNQGNIKVNLQDGEGNTGLMYACALGNTKIVKKLLEEHVSRRHTFKFTVENNEGIAALQYAEDGYFVDIVSMLSDIVSLPSYTRPMKSVPTTDNSQKHSKASQGAVSNNSKGKSTQGSPSTGSNDTNASQSPNNGVKGTKLIPGPSNNALKGIKAAARSKLQKSTTENNNTPKSETSAAKGNGNDQKSQIKNDSSYTDKNGNNSTTKKGDSSFSKKTENGDSSRGFKSDLDDLNDLVRSVRQCATDIKQICNDHDIDYKGEKKSRRKKSRDAPIAFADGFDNTADGPTRSSTYPRRYKPKTHNFSTNSSFSSPREQFAASSQDIGSGFSNKPSFVSKTRFRFSEASESSDSVFKPVSKKLQARLSNRLQVPTDHKRPSSQGEYTSETTRALAPRAMSTSLEAEKGMFSRSKDIGPSINEVQPLLNKLWSSYKKPLPSITRANGAGSEELRLPPLREGFQNGGNETQTPIKMNKDLLTPRSKVHVNKN